MIKPRVLYLDISTVDRRLKVLHKILKLHWEIYLDLIPVLLRFSLVCRSVPFPAGNISQSSGWLVDWMIGDPLLMHMLCSDSQRGITEIYCERRKREWRLHKTLFLRKHWSVLTVRVCCYSVSKLSDSLWSQGPQHTRLPCPSLSPGACSNSYSLAWWCRPTISPSAAPFPPALSLSQHQVVKVLELQLQHQSSVLPKNIQGWFPLGCTGSISSSPREAQGSSPTPQSKA